MEVIFLCSVPSFFASEMVVQWRFLVLSFESCRTQSNRNGTANLWAIFDCARLGFAFVCAWLIDCPCCPQLNVIESIELKFAVIFNWFDYIWQLNGKCCVIFNWVSIEFGNKITIIGLRSIVQLIRRSIGSIDIVWL